MTRSYLFVPGDSERKLEKAALSEADAIIVDLEDSVTADKRPEARKIAADFLCQDVTAERWVRINPLDTKDALHDLRAAAACAPDGIVLPKPSGARDVSRLAKLLDVLEIENGIEPGRMGILPIATEKPGALFKLHEYAQGLPRLCALSWGAEDLAAALGASSNRDDAGEWLPPYQLARSLCLFAAAAADVAAIDTVFTDYRNSQGLEAYACNARRDGFSGMLAIHPDQVPVINKAFLPSAAEIDRAEKIVALFAANPGAGVLGLDGEMLDQPHLLQARRLLSLAARDRQQNLQTTDG